MAQNIEIRINQNGIYNTLYPTTLGSNVSYSNSSTSSLITHNNVQGAIDDLFTSVSNGKSLIASAITDKGVSTSGNASFSTMSENIKQLETKGIATSTGGGIVRAYSLSARQMVFDITSNPEKSKIMDNIFAIIFYCSGFEAGNNTSYFPSSTYKNYIFEITLIRNDYLTSSEPYYPFQASAISIDYPTYNTNTGELIQNGRYIGLNSGQSGKITITSTRLTVTLGTITGTQSVAFMSYSNKNMWSYILFYYR